MGKVKVSNGTESFEIDGSDLQSAIKDGYKPTERIIVANSKTKESYEIDPNDVESALNDGFSFQDIVKKNGQSQSQPQSTPPTSTEPIKPSKDLLTLAKERKETQGRLAAASTPVMAPGAYTAAPNVDPYKKQLSETNEAIKALGGDDAFADDIADVPTGQGFSFVNDIPTLLKMRKENPNQYNRELAAIKSKGNLYNAIRDESDIQTANNVIQGLQQLEKQDYRAATKKGIALIRKHVRDGDEQNKLIKNYISNKAYEYGLQPAPNDDRFAHLNPYQQRAMQFLEDTDQGTFQAYSRLLSQNPDEQWMGSNESDIRRGYETKSKELENMGMNLQMKAYEEVLTGLKNKAESGKPLSADEQAKYNSVFQEYQTLAADKQNQSQRYPYVAAMDADRLMQEALGSKNSVAKKIVLGVGENFDDAINWVGDLLQDKGIAGDLELLGDKEMSGLNRYTSEKDRLIGSDFVAKFDDQLQKQIDEVKNSDLSEDQKQDRVRELILKNDDKINYIANDKAGKRNFTAKSVMNVVGDVASDLVSQLAIGAMTGGGGNASKIKNLSSLFGSTFATAYNDYYNEAIKNNVANPTQYAITHTTIEAATELINDDFEIAKKLAGKGSTLGKVLGNVTKEQWDNIAKKGFFSKLKDAAVQTGKTAIGNALQEAKEEVTGQIAGNIADQHVFNKETGIGEGVKHTFIQTMVGMAPLGLLSLPFNYQNINRNQRYAMYEAGMNPDKFLQTIDQNLASGTITQQEAQEQKENIQKVAKAVQSSPAVRTDGEPMTDNEKTDYAFNKTVLEEIKEQKKEAPPETKKELEKKEDEINKAQEELVKPKKQKTTPELKVINKAIKDGKIPDTIAGEAKKNPGEFFKMVADQVYGMNADGSESLQPDAEKAAREQFGDSVVDKAKELHPIDKSNDVRELNKVDQNEEERWANSTRNPEISKELRKLGYERIDIQKMTPDYAEELANDQLPMKLNPRYSETEINTPDDLERELTKALTVDKTEDKTATKTAAKEKKTKAASSKEEAVRPALEQLPDDMYIDMYHDYRQNLEEDERPLSLNEFKIKVETEAITEQPATAKAINREIVGRDGNKYQITLDDHGKDVFSVKLYHNKNRIGTLRLTKKKGTSDHYATGVDVDRKFQRLGLASKMYDLAEKQYGINIVPSSVQSKEGKAFWKNRTENKGSGPIKEKPTLEKKEQEMADYAYQNSFLFFKKKYPGIDVDEYNRLRSVKRSQGMPKLGEINANNNTRPRDEDVTQYTPESIIEKSRGFYKGDAQIESVLDFLEPIIKANPNIKIDTGFGWDKGQYEGSKITNQALGYSFPSGNMILNFKRIGDYDTLFRTALHEMVHAATRNEINKNAAFNSELKKVLSEVRSAMGIPDGDSLGEVLSRNGIISQDYDSRYGATNEHELLAEVFTNDKFFNFLKGLEYKGDGMLHRLFLAIAKFFSSNYKKIVGAKESIDVDNLADYLMQLTESVVSGQQEQIEGGALAQLGKSKEGKRVIFRGNDITDALRTANINPNLFDRILNRGDNQFRSAVGELRKSLLSSLNAGIEYWSKAISEKSVLNKEGDVSSVKINLINKYQARLDILEELKNAIEEDLLLPSDIVVTEDGGALPLIRPGQREVLKNIISKSVGKISDADIRGKLKQVAGLSDAEIDELLAEVTPPVQAQPSARTLSPGEIGQAPNEPKRKSGLRRFREKYFDRAKGMPDWMLKLKDRAKGTVHLEVRQALQLVEKTKQVAKKIGFDDWDLFDKSLRNQYYGSDLADLKELPPEMQVLSVHMRNKIDGLSRDLIINNYVTPEQALNIESNIGEYMTRSYRAFNEKDWSKKVPEQAREEAYRLLVQQRFDELYDPKDQEADVDSIIEQAKADAFRDLQSIIDGISDKYVPPKINVQKGKDLGVLKQRKDIPKEIREVLGEYTDPGVNFAMTIARIASLKSSAEYLNSVKNEGLGEIFFEPDSRPPEASVEIKAEGSETWNPLNGLYTTPEVKEIFDETEVIRNKWVQLWLKGVGAVKWGKTVGSLVTQVKNFESNLGFAIMNGHYRAGKSGESFKFLKDKLFGGEKSQDEMIEKVIRLGIVDQSIGVRELKDMFATDNLDKVILNSSIKEKSPIKKIGSVIGKPVNYLNKVYGASDDFWKVYGFLNEAESLSQATYDKPYKALTEEEKSNIDTEASERVKNVYPTYDRVWEGAKSLSKGLPIFGNFLSFQAESIRVLLNTFDYAIKDIKSPDRKMIGVQRLAGIAAYLSARTMILYTIAQMTGVGMAGLLGMASDDDEDQKLKDINRYSPEFIRSGDKLAMDHGDGKYTVYDVGSLEPYGVWFKTMNAYGEGNDIVKDGGIGASAAELLSPFVEPEMSFKMGLNLYNNENDFGGRIYNPTDGMGDKMLDAMGYVITKAKPSTIDLIQRVYEKENKTNEISAVFGGRGYDVDIPKNFSFKLKAAEDLFDANRDALNKVKYGGKATEEEIEEAQKVFEERTSKIVKMLAEDYQAAIRLGAKIERLDEVLDRKKFFQGYNKNIKNQIKSGVVDEGSSSSDQIKEWE